MEYILSLSYGKDSMACLGAIEKLGWQLDRIVTADVFATEGVSADLPEMVDFKQYADREIKRRYGINVEHYRSNDCFENKFYSTYKSGKHIGCIYGFPMRKGNWCTKLKTDAMRMCNIGIDSIQYLGIAADEKTRIEKHENRKEILMPLVSIGWTESDCMEWAKRNNLLSPIYSKINRGGGVGSAIIKA